VATRSNDPEIHVRHPRLRLRVVADDGTSAPFDRVYCRLRGASTPVASCRTCTRCEGITDGATPTVECTVPATTPLAQGDDAPVAAALTGAVRAISVSTRVKDALAILREDGRHVVPVVDTEWRLVGVVHELTFARDPSGGRASADHDVAFVMSSALALDESTTVGDALRKLAAAQLRDATVVSGDGRPLGIFRDVDGLQWLARARRAARGG
jgi:CBS domain-containing protein